MRIHSILLLIFGFLLVSILLASLLQDPTKDEEEVNEFYKRKYLALKTTLDNIEQRLNETLGSLSEIVLKKNRNEEIEIIRKEIESQDVKEVSTDDDVVEYLLSKFKFSANQVKRLVLEKKGVGFNEKTDLKCPNQQLKVATLNLWNIREPWKLRMENIVKQLERHLPDVIGFQEIRKDDNVLQIDQLAKRLSHIYPFSQYDKVRNEEIGSEEGIGILSKYPISKTNSFTLKPDTENIKNIAQESRICQQVTIDVPNFGAINIFNTHLTFIDVEQCNSAKQLLEITNSFPSEIPQVLLGDFNTYFDFEWPMDFLTTKLGSFLSSSYNPCSFVTKLIDRKNHENNLFLDSWEYIHKQKLGNTFSNFKNEDPSRPDRILFRNLNQKTFICNTYLFGDEPFDYNGNEMYISDHKGVISIIGLRE